VWVVHSISSFWSYSVCLCLVVEFDAFPHVNLYPILGNGTYLCSIESSDRVKAFRQWRGDQQDIAYHGTGVAKL
jgi:hypothetical protein